MRASQCVRVSASDVRGSAVVSAVSAMSSPRSRRSCAADRGGALTPQPPLLAGRGGAAAAPGRWCGTRLVGLAALAAAVVAGAGGAQALVGVDAGVVTVAPDGG